MTITLSRLQGHIVFNWWVIVGYINYTNVSAVFKETIDIVLTVFFVVAVVDIGGFSDGEYATVVTDVGGYWCVVC